MSITFYPQMEDVSPGTLEDRIDQLSDAAERYKAIVLETVAKSQGSEVRPAVPKDQQFAFNWDEIAGVLREIREMPEGAPEIRMKKANLLAKLSEIYEVLRAARMSKLEAVRLALLTEANQLKSGGASTTAAS
jgi:hypothetical protein